MSKPFKIFLAIVAIIVAAFIVLVIVVENDPYTREKRAEQERAAASSAAAEWLTFRNDRDTLIIYESVVETAAEKYVNVSFPRLDDFTFTDYDADDDGKVICSVKVSSDASVDKLNLVTVFATDGENYSCYYFYCGGKLYYDDGSCDETMAKLGMPTNSN